jgi:hypothetical protein
MRSLPEEGILIQRPPSSGRRAWKRKLLARCGGQELCHSFRRQPDRYNSAPPQSTAVVLLANGSRSESEPRECIISASKIARIGALFSLCLPIACGQNKSADLPPTEVGGHPTTVVWIKEGATRSAFEAARQQCSQPGGLSGKCMFGLGWTQVVTYFCGSRSPMRTTCSGPNQTGECRITDCH